MEPLKYIYNQAYFNNLTAKFKAHLPSFPVQQFMETIHDAEWENRELKDRMRHITQSVHQTLNLPFGKSVSLLRKLIEEGNGLANMWFPDYIEVYGLEHPEISLPALAHFTQFASSEFAIRPFILQDEAGTMKQMLEWSNNNNYHIRRLASEGCRPRLPWAVALPPFKKDPSLILPILENLKDDSEEYVRRSVANNLNDIAKDHPQLVLETGTKWFGASVNRDRLVKHALRTLLKQGNSDALQLFGFAPLDEVQVNHLEIHSHPLKIGQDLHFSFTLINSGNASYKVRLEYAIDYLKKTGKYGKKVFKISESQYDPGATVIRRKQGFKDLTTRKHNPGIHVLRIILNGEEKAQLPFELFPA